MKSAWTTLPLASGCSGSSIPESRSVYVYRPHGSLIVLGENDELLGDDVLPDFRCKIAELFEDL